MQKNEKDNTLHEITLSDLRDVLIGSRLPIDGIEGKVLNVVDYASKVKNGEQSMPMSRIDDTHFIMDTGEIVHFELVHTHDCEYKKNDYYSLNITAVAIKIDKRISVHENWTNERFVRHICNPQNWEVINLRKNYCIDIGGEKLEFYDFIDESFYFEFENNGNKYIVVKCNKNKLTNIQNMVVYKKFSNYKKFYIPEYDTKKSLLDNLSENIAYQF